MSEDVDFQVFGDWRDLRAAIERAVPDWPDAQEETRKMLWDFAGSVIAEYAPMKAKCLGCGEIIPARAAYRCADCNAHVCESCIKPHFGPNHRSHG